MISSRWPRPIGIMASMALMPVCSGSVTGWRWTTPGALNSTGRKCSVSIGPWSSSGLPSGSTTRPSSASPTGTWMTLPVRRTGSPSFDLRVVAEEHDTDVVLFEVQREAGHAVRELEHLERDTALEAVDARDAVTDLKDGPVSSGLGAGLVALDLLAQNAGDLVGAKLHRVRLLAASRKGLWNRRGWAHVDMLRPIASRWRRAEASSMTLPTRRIRPPMTSGSTRSVRAAGCRPVSRWTLRGSAGEGRRAADGA